MKKLILCLFVSLLWGTVGATNAIPISNLYGDWQEINGNETIRINGGYMKGYLYEIESYTVKNKQTTIVVNLLNNNKGHDLGYIFNNRHDDVVEVYNFETGKFKMFYKKK